VGEDQGKPFTGNMARFGKLVDTVIQAATSGPPVRELQGPLVDIDTGETDCGIGRGEDVAGQPGAATDITEGFPFMGRRNAVYRGASGQVLDMRFRVKAGGIGGDGNLKTPRKRD
jgi:hypothetical protein